MRLTFLWTDESTLLEDYRKKISKEMIDWANEFYGRYGFELDISPAPNIGKVPLAQKFCLRKTDGIRPDPDFDFASMFEEENKEIAPFELKVESNNSEISAFNRKIPPLENDIKALETQQEQLPPGDAAGRSEIHKKIMKKYDEISAIRNKTSDLYDSNQRQYEEMSRIRAKYEKKRQELDFIIPLRIQMGLKFLNENNVVPERLNIIFCKFINRKFLAVRKKKGHTIGIAYGDSEIIAIENNFVWPMPFIIIDILDYDPITLAHELVHTTGRVHPPMMKVIKNLEQYFKFKPAKGEGSILNRAITVYENQLKYQDLFKDVPGGLYDGPPNYILNYNSIGLTPDEVVLEDIDVERFKSVFFVI